MGGRRGTRTSPFGVSGRESHDSSAFYSRRLYASLGEETGEYLEREVPGDIIDGVHLIDSRDMSVLPDDCIHLVVTSPPYNVGKEYDDDLGLNEYLGMLGDVFGEVHRKLVLGGRACVNVANLGRRPYIPLHSHVIRVMLDTGFLMRGEIIWDKVAGAPSTAWGSWASAANPALRDTHEYILVFSKGRMARQGDGRASTISREEFLEYTRSVWSFPPESARRVGHPAPFPVELPYRLIQLYSFEGDVVLDPFCGSGTTCVAALKTGRRYIGFDNNGEYVELARNRIGEFLKGEA